MQIIEKLKKFHALDFQTQKRIFPAFFCLLFFRSLLSVLPYSLLKKTLLHSPRYTSSAVFSQEIISERLRAFDIAARAIGPSHCLSRAAAAKYWLSLSGIRAHIKIGIRKTAGQQMTAHAWLEYRDRVLSGEYVDDFMPIHTFSLSGN